MTSGHAAIPYHQLNFSDTTTLLTHTFPGKKQLRLPQGTHISLINKNYVWYIDNFVLQASLFLLASIKEKKTKT